MESIISTIQQYRQMLDLMFTVSNNSDKYIEVIDVRTRESINQHIYCIDPHLNNGGSFDYSPP